MAAQTAYADLGASATSASCVESTLGIDDGAASFEAKWKPAISGQIALDSKIYKNSSDTSGTAASTAAAPTPLYSAYDYSMYKTAQPTDANYTTTNKITAITTAPVKAGYVFEGFYTTKQYAESLASGTKVINTNKSFTSDATKQVTSPNGTATWYARWSPFISDAITLNSSMYKQSGASAVSATTAASPATVYSAYDYAMYSAQPTSSNYTASTNKITAVTAPTLTGYTFGGFYNAQQYVNAAASGTAMTNASGTFNTDSKKQRTSSGASTWYARWTPNISNAITLNNKIYATTSTTDANAITPTTAGTTTAYSAYDYALYSSKPTSSTYLTATQLSTITKPARAGYSFEGYCSTKQPLVLTTSASCTNSGTLMIDSSGTPQTAGKQKITASNGTDTWYALWRAIQYEIIYNVGQAGDHNQNDENYINGTGWSQTVTYGQQATIASNTNPGTGDTLTAVGYNFTGWISNVSIQDGQVQNTPYQPNEQPVYNYAGAATLTAQWAPQEYEITLNINTSNHGNSAGSPTKLYTRFDSGAYLESSRTNLMTTSANGLTSNPTGNTYTWTLNTNPPSGHTDAQVTAASGTKVATKTSAMTFKGFYSGATNGTQYIGSDGKITTAGASRAAARTANETWYAQYQCSSYTPYTPQLTGYTFGGWKDTETDTMVSGSVCLTKNITIDAQWSPNVSGAITIDSKLWKAADDSYAVGTYAAPATVYSRYEEGIYTPEHAAAGGSEGKLETLTTKPAKTGYTFAGIYNQKQILHTAASGTNVVNTTGNGTFTANAAKVVSASGGTSTWYTRWLPVISGTITLDSKVYDTAGTNATTNSSPTTVYSAFDYSMYSGSYTKPTTGTEATLYYNAPSSNCTSGTPCKIASVTAPTATGYTFAGFYTTKITAGSSTSGKTKVINADGTFTADATIQRSNTSAATWYAYYTKNQHTVSYDCGTKPSGASGSISGSAPSVTTNNATYNTSFTLSSTANTCALAGWNFDGWSCEYKLTDGTHTTTSYTAGQSVTFKVDNDVLCHAKWKAKETTITLNKNNGNTNADPATLYTRYDTGAYLDSDRTNLMSTSANGLTTIPTGNTYTFTMAKNASSVGHEDEEVTITSTTSTTPAATFKGFYNSATGSTQYIDADGKITTNGTNKAKTLTSAGTWYAQFNCATATAYTPSLTGYTFDGWYTAATGGTKKTSYCLTANTTYYAHWVAKTTTVAYNCGQTNANVSSTWTRPSGWSADTQTATYDAAFSHPASSACSTPAGYTFNSWCCVAGTTPATTGCLSGNGISSGNWNNTSANVICTAKWTPKNISLTYDANGGNVNGRPGGSAWSNTDGASTCVYDATFNLPTAPKKQGHKFCGWCTGSNCPGTCPAN